MRAAKRTAHGLSAERKRQLRRLARPAARLLPGPHGLTALALVHGTDKALHGYTRHYDRHFRGRRWRQLNLLEIGVGGYASAELGGASLRMWRDYFPRGHIHGLDIEDKTSLQSERIRIFTGSQADPTFLRWMAAEIGPLDIVVDDGSHVSSHVTTAFEVLFPLLNDGGIYAIEDIHTSYYPQYGGSWLDLGAPGTTLAMVKRLLDGLNHQYIPRRESTYVDQHVVSVHCYPKLVIIHKGRNVRALSELDEKMIAEAREPEDS